jgi:hypothetical protein
MVTDDKGIAIYHVVYKHEGFEDAARKLFEMVRSAAERYPGKPRRLYLDIEGHRDNAGGFDHDMRELQESFVLGFLGPYLSYVGMPLLTAERKEPQREDVPPALDIRPPVPPSGSAGRD